MIKDIVAGAVALVWIVISILFLVHFGWDQNNWDHALIVYNALSSVGFAAIGALLGVKVQQVNLANAKAETRNKTDAIRNALNALDLTAPAGDAGGGGHAAVADARGAAIAQARAILVQAV